MVALLVLLVLLGVALGDFKCNFIIKDDKGNKIVPPVSKDRILDCFKTLEWDDTLTDDLIDSLEKYVDIAQFTEVLKNPPEEYANIRSDQKAELEKIRTRAHSKELKYEYEIQYELAMLFNKAHDAHQRFYPSSCFILVGYVLPFGPSLRYEGGRTQAYFTEYSEEEITPLYELYQKYGGAGPSVESLRGLIGKRIKSINGYTPFEFYESLFDYVGWSKDLGSSINLMDRSSVFAGTIDQGFLMYKDKNGKGLDKLVIEFESEGGENLDPVTLDYIFLPIEVYGSDDYFKKFCYGEISATLSSSSEDGVSELKKLLRRDEPGVRLHTKELLEYYFRHQLPTDYDKKGDKVRASAEDTCLTNIVKFDNNNTYFYDIYQFTWDNTSYGVLVLKTFSYSEESHVVDLYNALKKLRDNYKISKLFIDLRGNGGGSVQFEYLMLKWLNGKSDAYTDSMWRRRQNEISDRSEKVLNDLVYDFYSHEKLDLNSFLEKTEYVSLAGTDEAGNVITKTYPYTGIFDIVPLNSIKDGKFVCKALCNMSEPIFSLDRESIIIIGDGVGGSATGMFMWGAQEFMIGRTVSVGGFKVDDTTYHKAGFASYTGGTVVNSMTFEYYLKLRRQTDDPIFPKAMPHESYFSFTWYSTMSLDQPNMLQEWRHAWGEMHVDWYSSHTLEMNPNYYEDWCNRDFLTLMLGTTKTQKYEHSLWPNPLKKTAECDKLSIDGTVLGSDALDSTNTECQVYYCNDKTYYDYYLKTCTPMHEITNASSGDDGNSSDAIWIVFMALMIVFVVATVVFVVLWVMERRKRTTQNVINSAY